MKKGFCAFFSVLILFLVSIAGYSQKVKFEFNPPVGLEYISEYDIQSSIDQTVMGIDQNVQSKTFMVIHSKVLDNNAEFCVLEMQYKRLAVETSTAFFSMIIDSEEMDEENSVNAALRALTNEAFVMKIGRNGSILSIEGIESLIEKMASVIPEEDKGREQYMEILYQSFGKDNLVQNLVQVSPKFPDYKIGKGEEWIYSQTVSASEFVFHLETIASLQGFEGKDAKIIMKSEMKTPPNNIIKMQGMNAVMALAGMQVGEINVNSKTGIVSSSILSQDINGIVEINMKDNGMENMRIPMKIKSSIHMKTEILK